MPLKIIQSDRAKLDIGPDADDRFGDELEGSDGRSRFVALLLGAIVTSGLLGILYYDSGSASRRDVVTTGSVSRIEAPAPRVVPSQPSSGEASGK